MHATLLTRLRADVLWFPVRRSSIEGRACREYDVTDDVGGVFLRARAFVWGRDILIAEPDGNTVLGIVRRRAFPITGEAIVTELPSGAVIGTVHRNGRFRDSAGKPRGRFQDARSFRERTTESVFQGAMEAIMATGADSMPSGPDALVLHVDGAPAGTLTYGVLPFARQPEATRLPLLSLLLRVLRERLHRLHAPRGWKFVRVGRSNGDPRLELAAAIFAADMSRW